MRFIAWDTSSKTGTVAAFKGEGDQLTLVSEWTLSVEIVHSEQLLLAIDEILKRARWKIEELDFLGVGVGPGSFTGLRIGVATARTLAYGLKKPLVGVSSLAILARPCVETALAQNVGKTKTSPLVVAATDACRGEWFVLGGPAGELLKYTGPVDQAKPTSGRVVEKVMTPEDLEVWMRKARGKNRGTIFLAGEAFQRSGAKVEGSASLPFNQWVQGRFLGLTVWEAYRAGRGRMALEVLPRYLRASQAELKLRQGLASRLAI